MYVYDLEDGSQTQFLTAMDTVIPADIADDSVRAPLTDCHAAG